MARVDVHHGDSREVLKTLADASIDSVVCDPPYALVSIGKRFGTENAAPAKAGKTGAYQRASAGFMGKTWDTGETAFAVEFWSEVYRVLKPGGHVVAFSGTRTYHRMTCAIEDAGFEIRDMLSWLYGSGFPKSHDVSKGIDKRGGNSHLVKEIGAAIKAARTARKITVRQADTRFCGGVTLWSWYEGRPAGQQMPSGEVMAAIAAEWPELGRYARLIAESERAIIGSVAATRLAVSPGTINDRSSKTLDVTSPATAAAAQWSGWGTALKPACEPIVLARKPLDGTVAANVLAHGTGALNIDGCRVEHVTVDGGSLASNPHLRASINGGNGGGVFPAEAERRVVTPSPLGRWPANVLHDGSDEVVEAFPQSANGHWSGETPSLAGKQRQTGADERHEVAASAARFFYTAKADAIDRLGSLHPTIKPTSLMRWLIRLVTPPGGTVLDPFAGSGSTGVAAICEGFPAILIERESEYVADIHRRLAWVRGEGRLLIHEMKPSKAPPPGIEGDFFE